MVMPVTPSSWPAQTDLKPHSSHAWVTYDASRSKLSKRPLPRREPYFMSFSHYGALTTERSDSKLAIMCSEGFPKVSGSQSAVMAPSRALPLRKASNGFGCQLKRELDS